MAGEMLADARTGKNGRHALVGLLRQSVFGRLAGYEDVNDAERLRHDPAMRWIVGGKAAQGACGIAEPDGPLRDAVARGGEEPLGSRRSVRPMDRPVCMAAVRRRGIVLDMDSSVSPTHGEQEMSVWNGHYACTCYHPLFVFNQFGDLERCALRPGNVHSADGWEDVLEPVVARYRGKVSRIYFRADAAFANARGLRVPGSRADQICDPASGQPGPAGAGSATCSSARSGDRRTRCAGSTPTSPIRREAGPSRAG